MVPHPESDDLYRRQIAGWADNKLLLVTRAVMFNPPRFVGRIVGVVRPVNQTTFGIPYVLAVNFNRIA